MKRVILFLIIIVLVDSAARAGSYDLAFSTYMGGGDWEHEWISTHNLALDGQGNAYIAVPSKSPDFPVTPGAFQSTLGSLDVPDLGVVKLSSTGALLAGTFIGGSGGENPDGIYADDSGTVFISGETQSTDFPVTSDAYQSNNHGNTDAVLVMLSADFGELRYATYVGGPSNDAGRAGFLGHDGTLYLAGSTDGADWPTLNAIQDSYAGGTLDVIVAKFDVNATVIDQEDYVRRVGVAFLRAIPNPFNSNTVIEFEIPMDDNVGNVALNI